MDSLASMSLCFHQDLIFAVIPHSMKSRKWYDRIRGVQYVHCVMHKCNMVKVGCTRNEIHVNHVKKHVNCSKMGTFVKVGREYNNFRETRGNVTEAGKIGGHSKIGGKIREKVIRNFGVWKSEIFSGKGKIVKIFRKVWFFFENRVGNLKQGGNASWHQGDGRPWIGSATTRKNVQRFECFFDRKTTRLIRKFVIKHSLRTSHPGFLTHLLNIQ